LKVAQILSDKLSDSENFSNEVIDLVTYVIILFSGDLPKKLGNLLSPSMILRAARSLYQQGRERVGRPAYQRAAELCGVAATLTDEASLRRDLQAVQARSLMRLKHFSEADKIIAAMEMSPGRQSLGLRAQYFRFQKDYATALPLYRSLVVSGYRDNSNLHEYFICLRKTGNFEELRTKLEEYDSTVQDNVYLLATKISLQVGGGQFRGAEASIERLKALPDPLEIAAEKEAVLLARESRNFSGALNLLNAAIARVTEGGHGIAADLHSTRCLIYCKLRMIPEARVDLNIVRTNHRDGEFVTARLEIHLAMAEGKYDDAMLAFNRLPNKTRLDQALHLELIEEYVENRSLSLVERNMLEVERNKILASRVLVTEFDF
jgi:hypothetical protein